MDLTDNTVKLEPIGKNSVVTKKSQSKKSTPPKRVNKLNKPKERKTKQTEDSKKRKRIPKAKKEYEVGCFIHR